MSQQREMLMELEIDYHRVSKGEATAQDFIACFKAMFEYADCLLRLRQNCLMRQVLCMTIVLIYEYERAEFDRSMVAERIVLRNVLLQILENRFGDVISVRSYFQYLTTRHRSALDQ